MSTFRKVLTSGSLVRRLRTACLILVAGFAITAGTAIWSNRIVEDSRTQIAKRAIPKLLIAHDTFEAIIQETERANRLRWSELRADVVTLHHDYLAGKSRLDLLLSRLASVDSTDVKEIDPALTAFDVATRRLYETRRAAMDAESRQGVLRRKAERMAEQAIEPLLHLRNATIGALENGRPISTVGADVSRSSLFDCLAAQDALYIRIATLSDGALLGFDANGVPSGSLEADTDAALACSAERAAGAVHPIEQKLRDSVAGFGQLLTAAGGRDDAIAQAGELNRTLDIALQEHGAAAARLRQIVDAVVHRAGGRLSSAGQSLERSGRIAEVVLVLQALLMIATIAILVGLVEYQLNRRLTATTDALRAISAGRFDTVVSTRGTDEIGEIADMLRTAERTGQDLIRSNKDLEGFSFAASHDLQSPLQAMSNLASWILEDADNELSQESRARLTLLKDRARRLSQLLLDLLDYARIGEADGIALVDPVAEAKDAHLSIDPENRFTLEIEADAGPVLAPTAPLRQILHNLLSNAIKHHDRSEGRIRVGTRMDDDALVLTVADDGPGIPPVYHQRVFRLFEKLETRDNVNGSGLGLALVRKLVLRHGGRIDIVSDPEIERGTEFVLRMPAKPARGGIASPTEPSEQDKK